MKNLLSLLFKQYDIGPWWGAAKSTIGSAALYLTMFNTVMLVPMAYVTWVNPWFLEQGIIFPFWMFIVILFFGGIAVLLFEYKLFTPSGFNFWSEQFWKHSNPMKDKMEEHDKRFNEQDEKIDLVLEELKRIKSK
jgi:hypothetical protein